MRYLAIALAILIATPALGQQSYRVRPSTWDPIITQHPPRTGLDMQMQQYHQEAETRRLIQQAQPEPRYEMNIGSNPEPGYYRLKPAEYD